MAPGREKSGRAPMPRPRARAGRAEQAVKGENRERRGVGGSSRRRPRSGVPVEGGIAWRVQKGQQEEQRSKGGGDEGSTLLLGLYGEARRGEASRRVPPLVTLRECTERTQQRASERANERCSWWWGGFWCDRTTGVPVELEDVRGSRLLPGGPGRGVSQPVFREGPDHYPICSPIAWSTLPLLSRWWWPASRSLARSLARHLQH